MASLFGVVFNFEIIWKKRSCVFVQRGFSAFKDPKGANGQKKVKNRSRGERLRFSRLSSFIGSSLGTCYICQGQCKALRLHGLPL